MIWKPVSKADLEKMIFRIPFGLTTPQPGMTLEIWAERSERG